jgi:hypothetical protein
MVRAVVAQLSLSAKRSIRAPFLMSYTQEQRSDVRYRAASCEGESTQRTGVAYEEQLGEQLASGVGGHRQHARDRGLLE